MSFRPGRRSFAAAAVVPLLAVLAACGGDSGSQTSAAPGSAASVDAGTPAETLRLGYFANVTHAPAVVGEARGFIAGQLGDTTLETQIFNAGPAAIEALNAGAIDAAYLGPNPAINAYVKSNGEAVRIVAGAMSGGAQLVVSPDISDAGDLTGANLATPQLGGTQDVALRAWLTENGIENSPSGGGDVTITPTENAQTLQLFQDAKLDGAWLPEPWASRLVLDAGAKVLVDEKDLWPEGEFITTHLIVATKFLEKHPQTIKALIAADQEAIEWITANPDEAKTVVNAEIGEATGKPLSEPVIDRAFLNITPTIDPLAGTLATLLDDGVNAGVVKKASLEGIYDLRLLNEVLEAAGKPAVSAAGLGQE